MSIDDSDLISGWRYNATLQLRTPLTYLERHGEFSPGPQEPPMVGPAEGHLQDGTGFNPYGIWLREIDPDILPHSTTATRATDWGQVRIGSEEERNLVSFLKSFRYIVETAEGLDQKLSELKELSTSTPGNRRWWARCAEGSPLWPDSYFIGELWIQLPKGVGSNMAEKLYQAGFRTMEEVQAASDGELLAVPGLGKGLLAKARAFCLTILFVLGSCVVGAAEASGSPLPISSLKGRDCSTMATADDVRLCSEVNAGKLRLPAYPVKYTSSPRKGYMFLLGEQGASGRFLPSDDGYVEIRSTGGTEITFAFGPVGPCLWCTVKEVRSITIPGDRIRGWAWNYEDMPYKLNITYVTDAREAKSIVISMDGDRNSEINALLEDVTGKKATSSPQEIPGSVEERCSKAADYKGCMEYHRQK